MGSGNTLFEYKIIDTLFSSDRTLIQRVERLDNGKCIILKKLNKEFPTASDIARFEYEYDLAKLCANGEGVSVSDFTNSGTELYFAMEDNRSIDLHLFREQTKELDLEIFFQITLKMTEILKRVHEKRVIHKDINLSNFIICPETGDVNIIDFGIASILPREQAVLKSPDLLEGTLTHIAPEQTGRINRSIDYRTDFYSLGVSLYELITGTLPFQSKDGAELVHCHIAKQPESLTDRKSSIPKILSDIILKCMAKESNDRYQSASGLLFDLHKCHQYFTDGKNLNSLSFKLGERDISEQLTIPEKIYGRRNELKELENALFRVSQGRAELYTIAGFSGVGKTALVKELYKSISKKQGYFISGKFDQFQNNVPYSAVVQAFRELVQQVLTESEENLLLWKEKILEAIGSNGAVITEVLPDIELIIGKQPAVSKVEASENQKRFDLIFQSFMAIFCTKEHPVVIFLDDMQWVDSASLKLIELMAAAEENALLLILAYRDNEVDPTHVFSITLEKIREKSSIISELSLSPLEEDSVGKLLADTLDQSTEQVSSLTSLIMEKTEGNPFFVDQFLLTLYTENLLTLKAEKWQWDIETIQSQNMTDNVIELMVQKLQKLSVSTQKVVQLAAMIGNNFDLETLAIIYSKKEADTFLDLLPILKDGLVVPLSEVERKKKKTFLETKQFRFLHDRVQQASYSLVEETKKAPLHLSIARLLTSRKDETFIEENLFEVTNHYNKALSLVTEDKERLEIVQFNLRSGIKSRGFTSYDGSFAYLKTAYLLLPEDIWQKNYDLAYEVYLEYCESGFLATYFEEAEKILNLMINNVRTPYERAQIYNMQAMQLIALEDTDRGIPLLLLALKELNVNIPRKPNPFFLIKELLTANRLRHKKSFSDIINLPHIKDKSLLLAVKILSNLTFPSFTAQEESLFAVVCLRIATISLKFGHNTEAAYGYIMYGMILNLMGKLKDAKELGEIGLKLNESISTPQSSSRVLFFYTFAICPWNEMWQNFEKLFIKAINAAKETGDLFMIAWASTNAAARQPDVSLDTIQEKLNNYYTLTLKAGYPDAIDAIKTLIYCNAALLGQTYSPFSFSCETYDEMHEIEKLEKMGKADALTPLYLFKCKVSFIHGDPVQARSLIPLIDKGRKVIDGNGEGVLHALFTFLSEAACFHVLSKLERKKALKRMNVELKRVSKWADHNPTNFEHLRCIMLAELARISGNVDRALRYFPKAIEEAQKINWLQHIAIYSERYAEFWYEQENNHLGDIYIKEAHYRYQIWGATVKVGLLEEKYSFLKESTRRTSVGTSYNTGSSTSLASTNLDLNALLKAMNTLSGEIELTSLLHKMLSIVIENGGAERGVLLLPKQDQWSCEAEGFSDERETVVASRLIISGDLVPLSIVHYISRTKESVVLGDASKSEKFSSDHYITGNSSKSILALPLINQGNLIAILYLENSLSTEVFTPERTEMLKLISTQAAVSIEKSQLIAKEKKLLMNLHHSEKLQAIGQLASGIAHDFNNQLSVMGGCADIIKTCFDESNEVTELADNIMKSVEHSVDLTKQILAFARKKDTKLTSININALIQEVEKLLYHTVSKTIAISTELGTDCIIHGDHSQLQSALLNLGINARDAIGKKRGFIRYTTNRITITDDWNRKHNKELSLGEYAEISVSDNGSGIPDKIREKIFEPFYTTKVEGKGTGMGLAAVLGTAESHGGTVLLKSEIGMGTTFSLYLPSDN